MTPLFDLLSRQAVHIFRYSPAAGLRVCACCKASEPAIVVWDDCQTCPGWVDPAAAGALLAELAPAATEAAGAELGEAA